MDTNHVIYVNAMTEPRHNQSHEITRCFRSRCTHFIKKSFAFCSPTPFQEKRGGGGGKQGGPGPGPALTQRGGDALGVLQLPGAAAAGCAVGAGARRAHAHAVGVVGREQGCGHAVLQQGREDEHGVPPVVGHFRHSLEWGRARPRGTMADKKQTRRLSRGRTASCPLTLHGPAPELGTLRFRNKDGRRCPERFLSRVLPDGRQQPPPAPRTYPPPTPPQH